MFHSYPFHSVFSRLEYVTTLRAAHSRGVNPHDGQMVFIAARTFWRAILLLYKGAL